MRIKDETLQDLTKIIQLSLLLAYITIFVIFT